MGNKLGTRGLVFTSKYDGIVPAGNCEWNYFGFGEERPCGAGQYVRSICHSKDDTSECNNGESDVGMECCEFTEEVEIPTPMPQLSGPTSYQEYVADEVKPVCGKQVTGGGGMCNLFKSCFTEFSSGVTGQRRCQAACAKMVEFFP